MRRWLRVRPWVVAFFVLALASIVALGQLHEQNRKVEDLVQTVVEVQEAGCSDRQSARAAVRKITGTLKAIIGDSTPDYSSIPGFDELDPATRAFVTASAANPSFREAALTSLDQALVDLPPISCPPAP